MDTADAHGTNVSAAAIAATTVLFLIIFLLVMVNRHPPSTRNHRRRGRRSAVRCPPTPPGPTAYSTEGSLYVMSGHSEQPFRRFTELAGQYGPVFSMRMHRTPCVIVNDYESIKEVLVTKGPMFVSRPGFMRYKVLFKGRNNSLALSDWMVIQETRRRLALKYCSSNYSLLDSVATDELKMLLESLANITVDGFDTPVRLKNRLLVACANMFMRSMCSERFDYNNGEFKIMIVTYDHIFWDINHGYSVDFIPWFEAFYGCHKKLFRWSTDIRGFMKNKIVSKRSSYAIAVLEESGTDGQRNHDDEEPVDFTVTLLMSLRKEPGRKIEHVLFELEDFIGGHTVVGNLVMIALSIIATRPHVAEAIREEAEEVTGGQRSVRLYDKPDMPYTEATLYETLRIMSSPVAPLVATETTTIQGLKIDKGTCIIINDYELNTSPTYWDEPETFDPNRFVRRRPGAKPCVWKPKNFLPISSGKRTCIGQQLVFGFGLVLLAGILQKYEVNATDELVTPEVRMARPQAERTLNLKPLEYDIELFDLESDDDF